jgi:hypothetical protein
MRRLYIKELKNSRKLFAVILINIQIHGNIFQIYDPVSRKILRLLTLLA